MSMTMSGGGKLEAYLKRVAKRVANPPALKVGFLEGATYPDGTSVATVAVAQEFGTDKIPSRPFFRTMLAEHSDEWGPALGSALKAKDYDANAALAIVGEGIKGQLQQSIVDTNDPPLSQETVRRKGSDKPLIETSHMINSVDSEVG